MNKNLKEMLDFYKTAKANPASALEKVKKEEIEYFRKNKIKIQSLKNYE